MFEDYERPRVHFLTIQDTPLDLQFKRFWETEIYGTEGEESRTIVLSEVDQRAVAIVQEGTKKLNPGYEVPIPWKPNKPNIENNRAVAIQRLNGLMRKFDKDPEYHKEYQAAVKKYIDDGYAQKITEQTELDHPKQWFLPHHGVYKKIS